jgi:hypothetical protein
MASGGHHGHGVGAGPGSHGSESDFDDPDNHTGIPAIGTYEWRQAIRKRMMGIMKISATLQSQVDWDLWDTPPPIVFSDDNAKLQRKHMNTAIMEFIEVADSNDEFDEDLFYTFKATFEMWTMAMWRQTDAAKPLRYFLMGRGVHTGERHKTNAVLLHSLAQRMNPILWSEEDLEQTEIHPRSRLYEYSRNGTRRSTKSSKKGDATEPEITEVETPQATPRVSSKEPPRTPGAFSNPEAEKEKAVTPKGQPSTTRKPEPRRISQQLLHEDPFVRRRQAPEPCERAARGGPPNPGYPDLHQDDEYNHGAHDGSPIHGVRGGPPPHNNFMRKPPIRLPYRGPSFPNPPREQTQREYTGYVPSQGYNPAPAPWHSQENAIPSVEMPFHGLSGGPPPNVSTVRMPGTADPEMRPGTYGTAQPVPFEDDYNRLPPRLLPNGPVDVDKVTNFSKLWNHNNDWSGEPYDLLDDKLRLAMSNCSIVGLMPNQFFAVIPLILKGRAQQYFLTSIGTRATFYEMYIKPKEHFETSTNHAQYFNEWTTLTFNGMRNNLENAELSQQ